MARSLDHVAACAGYSGSPINAFAADMRVDQASGPRQDHSLTDELIHSRIRETEMVSKW